MISRVQAYNANQPNFTSIMQINLILHQKCILAITLNMN